MMSIRETSPVIAAYLNELEAGTAHLPADEQFDIRDSIEAHISDMIGTREHIDDDEARRILAHLGPVSSITAPSSTQPMGADAGATRILPHPAKTAPSTPGNVLDAALVGSGRQRPPGYARIAVILAIVTMLAYLFFTPLSLVTGLAALVFGILGLRAGESRAEAWAGILIGVLPIVLAGILFLLGASITNTVVVN